MNIDKIFNFFITYIAMGGFFAIIFPGMSSWKVILLVLLFDKILDLKIKSSLLNKKESNNKPLNIGEKA